ncbi:sugar phosphate nucleotidyltransferase [Candidatus Zixiibacteriota bacterium]
MTKTTAPSDNYPMHNVAAVILAAGQGKRMKSDLPKVLHLLHDKPLLLYVLASCREAGLGRLITVVGFQGERVIEAAQQYPVEIVWQKEQLGTGHAVLQAELLFAERPTEIVVMNGDVPLISSTTIRSLVEEHRRRKAAATVLTAEVENPTGYGRIVRNADGLVDRIVEEADADEQTRQVREINSGMFCFAPGYLFQALHMVGKQNRQGEYYLTDVLTILRHDGYVVAAHKVKNAHEVLGVNSLEQLKQIAQLTVKH